MGKRVTDGAAGAPAADCEDEGIGTGSCETVRVERMGYGPEAVAHRADGKTVFLAGAAPGDVVRMEVVEEKPSYARGRVVGIEQPSALRASEQPCPFAQACGGCAWAHLSYAAQCDAKRAAVVDALERTAHMPADVVEDLVGECLPSKRQWGYRNKLELAAGRDERGRFAVGFHRAGTHEIVSVDSCPLAHRYIERAPKALRGALRYLQGSGDLGIYRIGVRASLRTNSVEVALWTPPSSFPRTAVAKTLRDAVRAKSVVRVLADPGKARVVKKIEVLEGRGLWEEKLRDELLSVSAPSFFQVNTAQAEKLVDVVTEGLEIAPGDLVADLYAGVGTFSLPLARAGADVIAVEVAGSSVRDLRRNADAANLDVEVVCGDVARELPELGGLDALVVDPPRAGLGRDVIDALVDAAPQRLAYVSCNPQTWARDVALLSDRGFDLTSAVPVDLFPQTYHVEVASVFRRV